MERTYAQRYYAEHQERMKRQSTEARRRRQQREVKPKPVPRAELSPRERQILTLVARGYLNKEIAARLCLAIGTVKANTNRLYQKLRVRNRAEAVRWAMQRGVIC